jgi:hypothetical protein
MTTYDEGESFAAGDDDPDTKHFPNDRLIILMQILDILIPDDGVVGTIPLRTRVRLAILKEIFGEAEEI